MARLEEAIKFVCAVFYLIYVNLSGQKQRGVVLYYHGVKKQDVARFENQMAYLSRNCTVVRPSDIKTAQISGTANIVAITFDDGFVSVIENALPILNRYRMQAAVFVPSDYLGKEACWDRFENCCDNNERVMDGGQIIKMEKQGFEVFSHTCTHPDLRAVEDARLEEEMKGSKDCLERITGHEITAISYPYGSCDSRVYDAVKRAGYKLGFTIEPELVDDGTDCLKIGRFQVSLDDSLMKFKLKVIGAYQITKYLSYLKKLFFKD